MAKKDEGNNSKYYQYCDVAYIMEFFLHAIGILDAHLSKERLEQVGCRLSEVEEILAYLESKLFSREANEGETQGIVTKESSLQEHDEKRKLMTLESLEHQNFYRIHTSNPFKGSSISSKRRSKRRLQ